ncbi:hypothetical protein ACHQM5_016810 [Ranunculus cassubicifolius]
MDFVEGLPVSEGKSVILVVVDRFSKYSHFVAIKHPFSASSIARIFIDQIFKLHGLPTSIVSDRGSVFISNFWTKLFEFLGITLLRSTAYHPQTDGQTERVNQCMENFLRCMSSMQPTKWARWLPLAEYWYNTSFHTALKCSPFEVLYGQSPPSHIFPQHANTGQLEVDQFVHERSQALEIIKSNLQEAQSRMKYFADKNRVERSFEVNDMVFMRLQPYRQNSVSLWRNLTLAPKFYGPYKILERVGKVAYRLELPADSLIHPVLHVSQLKKQLGTSTIPVIKLPTVTPSGEFLIQPYRVLDTRVVQVHGRDEKQWLIQWSPEHKSDSSWEPATMIEQRFPHFHP